MACRKMDELFLVLQYIYKRLLFEKELKNDACEVARVLIPCVSMQNAHFAANVSCQAEETQMGSRGWQGSAHLNAGPSDSMNPDIGAYNSKLTNETSPRLCHNDFVLLQLTLVEMLSCKAQNPLVDVAVQQQYINILTILDDMGIVVKLLHLFSSTEKLLCHTAAKCVASLVLFHMRNNVLNSTWLKMCLKTLSEDAYGCRTAECLWSLTTVIKCAVKDHSLRQSGILQTFFAQLDPVLEGYYILALSCDSHDKLQANTSRTRTESTIISNLASFIDLLEVLVASRVYLQSDFLCQRLLHLHSDYALQLLTSSVHYVAKRKLVILLKKCLVWKAGEDLVNTPVPHLPDSHCLSNDTFVLAETVLHTATLDWLTRIPVSENVVQFGGSSVLAKDSAQVGPDMVFLRALSLTLLKAVEINAAHSATEMERKADPCVFLSQLMVLLRRHLKSTAQVKQLLHPCAWISLVFMEQDDDMMEAAKAMLTIYLHHERSVISSDSTNKEKKSTTMDHELGCNPHCVFLHLLNSIAFDHAVLLDYLISTETCFLEYLVRYLKLLQKDWQHFISACELCQTTFKNTCCTPFVPNITSKETADISYNLDSKTEGSNLKVPTKIVLSSSCTSEIMNYPYDCRPVVPDVSLCSLNSDSVNPVLPAAQSLVDYDISDDSEPELSKEASLAEVKQPHFIPQDSNVLKEHEHSFFMVAKNELCMIQNHKMTASIEDHNSSVCCRAEEDLGNTETFEDLHVRAFKCLRDLQNAIARLHCKKLFPYNPAALLKLLGNVKSLSEVY
ncbi:protein Lines homolog 1 [Protopterus annectens]|uniref:protein Lines homolog 1 n=1 Tax=Protopterus annectens TaxID=7888 RepID=UPI001CFAFD79|nr:protein Lines homolog 1 [Protopterus annectens]